MRYSIYINGTRGETKHTLLQEAADSISYATLDNAKIVRIYDERDGIWYRVRRSDYVSAIELTVEDLV